MTSTPFLRFWFGLLFLFGSATSVHALTLHVAPGGNDEWSGRHAKPMAMAGQRDGPLASLTGARDRIRKLRTAQPIREPIIVLIHAGKYFMQQPLVLENQDSGTEESPIRYKAAPHAKPVFSGGVTINNWRRGADGVWSTELKDVKEGKWYFEQLWINNRRATRARASTETFYYMTGVREKLFEWAFAPGKPFVTYRVRQVVAVRPEDLRLLNGLTEDERKDVNFMAFHKWDTTRRFLDAVNIRAGTITVQGSRMQPWNPMAKHTPFYLDNFRAALDTPGEWFLARDGVLYYKPLPGEDMVKALVIAPVTDKFMVLRGAASAGRFVEHISFEGLTFLHSQWLTPTGGVDPVQSAAQIEAVIMVDGARHIQIQDCEIGHLGTYAIWLRSGNRNVVIKRCHIHDMGAGGVRVGNVSIAANESDRVSHITVDNNIIRHGGRIFPSAAGIWIGQSGDNQVTHNEIADFFSMGISAGWTWGYGTSLAVRNRIAFNRIHHIGWRMLSELAGIYTLGVSPGTVINNNVVHDMYAFDYGGWGLVLDQGSSDITVQNNLVYRTMSGAFHQNGGRNNLVENNVFAFGQAVQWHRARADPHLSLTFINNIVYWDEGRLFEGPLDSTDVKLERNIYFDASGQSVHWGNMDFAAWQESGKDAGSLVVDPLFVAPREFDFNLEPQSPAIKLGFRPIEFSQAGPYGDPKWLRLAQRERYAPVEIPPAMPSLSHLP
ncbi:MAG: right-handed parallel beta-helix repeat-containing protein [Nevskiales bacterium]